MEQGYDEEDEVRVYEHKRMYYINKNLKKIWVNQIFLICYEYINNNSYFKLDDGNRTRIVWSCSSNAVKTHNVSYIP